MSNGGTEGRSRTTGVTLGVPAATPSGIGTVLIAPTTDAPPLVPIVVPASGAFSQPKPVLTTRPAPTAPFTQAPLRPIHLPTSAELDAQIAAAFKRGASAAEIKPLAQKLIRAKAREAARPTVPGLPGLPTGTAPRDDTGKPIPGVPTTPVTAIPIPGVPSGAAPKPASDVVETAGSAVGGRIVKDVLTFALLTSPAWLAVLLFPRRP